jgi:predicted Ser/Thr protein kinase
MVDLDGFLQETSRESEAVFQGQKRILSFRQYLDAFCAAPERLGRSAAQYLLDAFDHFGTEDVSGIGGKVRRFKLFDAPFDNGRHKLFGYEETQNTVYSILRRFAATGRADRLILIHGPNGSGKTSFIDLIVRAIEHYSTLEEGAFFRINWIFTERLEGKEHLGFGATRETPGDTLAFVDENLISCKIVSELRENPIFLLPPAARGKLFERLLASAPADAKRTERLCGTFLREGTLSSKSKEIYEALLTAHRGDWSKVVRHVQVERCYVSKRFRDGAAVVEAQQSVDAGARPLNFDPGVALPPFLQGRTMLEVHGELADGSGGIVEFSDMLKRPLEMNKYLLNACERGTVSVAGTVVHLNSVFLGTCNSKYLTAFKASPDFTSFKGRLELARMGYLLEWKKEREIYRAFLGELAGSRHVAPHTLDVTALWAVLTRLRKPDPGNYPSELSGVVSRLTPLQKARLYGEGQLPEGLNGEEQKALWAAIPKLRDEYNEAVAEFEEFVCSAYEGRRGASSREVMTLLADASRLPDRRCLSPLAVFDAIEEILKDRTVYDFLRLNADEGYQDAEGLTEDAFEQYFHWVLIEAYDSMELIAGDEFNRRVEEYFRHAKAYVAGEKVENTRTGKYDDPSEDVLGGMEKLLELKEESDAFRRNLMTQIAAYSLENIGKKLRYQDVFPDLFARLRESYYKQQQPALATLARYVIAAGTEDDALVPQHERPRVVRTLANMRERHGYCDHCTREALSFILRKLADE